MEVTPIGTFFGDAVYKYDAPRQGCLFAGHPGRIELQKGQNFETALRDLEGFERIWVLFQFHRNEGWRPTTRPPVPAPGRERVGTFASRSPYRPNSIGLSCVRLLKVEGLVLYVDESDLLNETPVLDIKPYIPMADAFPNARAGWADMQSNDSWSVEISSGFAEQSALLVSVGGPDLIAFAKLQLSNSPFDTTRKRVETFERSGVLSFRVFRIDFSFDCDSKTITLNNIRSGYTKEELALPEDRYGDKDLHRNFLVKTGQA